MNTPDCKQLFEEAMGYLQGILHEVSIRQLPLNTQQRCELNAGIIHIMNIVGYDNGLIILEDVIECIENRAIREDAELAEMELHMRRNNIRDADPEPKRIRPVTICDTCGCTNPAEEGRPYCTGHK